MGKNVRKMDNGDYLVEHGHYVRWTGESHESWSVSANQLNPSEALAVLCAAQTKAQPYGEGSRVLEQAKLDAGFAIDSNCGRQDRKSVV